MGTDTPITGEGLIFYAPLMGDTMDVISNMSGDVSGIVTFSGEGAYFNKGCIRYAMPGININDWNYSWTVEYTIKNTAIGGYNQLSFEFGTYSSNSFLIMYTPLFLGNAAQYISLVKSNEANRNVISYLSSSDYPYSVFRTEKIVWDGSAKKYRFYINGGLCQESNIITTPAFVSSNYMYI
jgi:hypothetical protein